MRHLTNEELFQIYDNELVLRLYNAKNLSDTRRILARFKGYLSGLPPSTQTAKAFLTQFTGKRRRTLYRYTQMIKGFMKWYGEPLDDFKVKVPKTIPPYTRDDDIDKLFKAIENKASHKGCIARDRLMVKLALATGMRRGELANLETKDIHDDFLIVRSGKGEKDRVIPLSGEIAEILCNFVEGKKHDEKVFGLKPACLGNKIRQFAKKAGLNDLHTHTLIHKFATDLLEHGADLRSVQHLLGHENLSTTQVYLSITDKRLRETVNLLSDETKGLKTLPEGQESKDEPKLRYDISDRGALVTIKAVHKLDEPVDFPYFRTKYLSHFVVRNEGDKPAIEVEIGLLKEDLDHLVAHRQPAISAGEEVRFKPDMLKVPEGRYHILCQYKQIFSEDHKSAWFQAWLSFRLVKAIEEKEVYIAQEEFNLKSGIPEDSRIIMFTSKPE